MSFIPPHFPQLSLYLTVTNPLSLIDFYEKAFGFSLRDGPHLDENNQVQHVEMSFGDAVIMFASDQVWLNAGKPPKASGTRIPVRFYLYCENTDALYQKAIAHGAVSLEAPQDTFWGDRFCMLRDIEGYEWSFATHKPSSSKIL